MSGTFNIYCDESCHLENDHQLAMVLGAVWCPIRAVREIAGTVRSIKKDHGHEPHIEVKWGKISPGNVPLYRDLVAYFFREPRLHFRALIVPDKRILDHAAFDQNCDDFYYKMYYTMLRNVVDSRDDAFRIYLDIKDTRSARKAAKLHEVLCNKMHDFARQRIATVQHVNSREIQQLQLADVLIGAVSYANRGLATSAAKLDIVREVADLAGVDLRSSTPPWARKVNLLRWVPRGSL
jgi:hypothetical protein